MTASVMVAAIAPKLEQGIAGIDRGPPTMCYDGSKVGSRLDAISHFWQLTVLQHRNSAAGSVSLAVERLPGQRQCRRGQRFRGDPEAPDGLG